MQARYNGKGFNPEELAVSPVDNIRLRVGPARQFQRAYLEPDRLPDWGYGNAFDLAGVDQESIAPELIESGEVCRGLAAWFGADKDVFTGASFVAGFSAAHRLLEMQARSQNGELVTMWQGISEMVLGNVVLNTICDTDVYEDDAPVPLRIGRPSAGESVRLRFLNTYMSMLEDDRQDNKMFMLMMIEAAIKEDKYEDPADLMFYSLGNAAAYHLFLQQLSTEHSLVQVTAGQFVMDRPVDMKKLSESVDPV